MALTSAVANAAAAAAAAGAGKKAAQVQLQAELNNDEDWNKFLQRDGLLVVDVYTEWCGPCIGMVGNLKKIKVEIGGDNLHLAVAKSDTIEVLKRFRKRSEPTWMFIASGQLLNVVFGADAPRLTRTIEQELKNEERARKGELQRPKRAPHELTPPEQEVATAQEKIYQERRAREAAAIAAARQARREARATRIEAHFADICPALVMPHAQKSLRKIAEILEQNGVIVADKYPSLLGKEVAKRLAVEDPELGSPASIATLCERPAVTLLLKKLPEKDGDLIELAHSALYGDGEGGEAENPSGGGEDEEDPPKRLMYWALKTDAMPGLFVPADRHQRAAALDVLFPKMVGTVLDPPVPPEPPHIAMMFGAWQRRAVLAAASMPTVAARLMRYGFFADASVTEPKLLCKSVEKYDERPEKDFGETIVLMVAVGLSEPELAEPGEEVPDCAPPELVVLGPLHASADSVAGAAECARLFPPGYSDAERKPRGKGRKKKKKRHENKEGTVDSTDAPPASETSEAGAAEDTNGGSAEGEENGEGEGEENGEGDDSSSEDVQGVDKATSPPPTV